MAELEPYNQIHKEGGRINRWNYIASELLQIHKLIESMLSIWKVKLVLYNLYVCHTCSMGRIGKSFSP